MTITQVREQFPEYNDLSDEELALGIYDKYYSDLDWEDYVGRIGLAPGPEAFQPPEPDPMQREPVFEDLPVIEDPGYAVGAVLDPLFAPGRKVAQAPVVEAVPEAFMEPEDVEYLKETAGAASIEDATGAAGRGLWEYLYNLPGPKKARFAEGELRPGDAGELVGRTIGREALAFGGAHYLLRGISYPASMFESWAYSRLRPIIENTTQLGRIDAGNIAMQAGRDLWQVNSFINSPESYNLNPAEHALAAEAFERMTGIRHPRDPRPPGVPLGAYAEPPFRMEPPTVPEPIRMELPGHPGFTLPGRYSEYSAEFSQALLDGRINMLLEDPLHPGFVVAGPLDTFSPEFAEVLLADRVRKLPPGQGFIVDLEPEAPVPPAPTPTPTAEELPPPPGNEFFIEQRKKAYEYLTKRPQPTTRPTTFLGEIIVEGGLWDDSIPGELRDLFEDLGPRVFNRETGKTLDDMARILQEKQVIYPGDDYPSNTLLALLNQEGRALAEGRRTGEADITKRVPISDEMVEAQVEAMPEEPVPTEEELAELEAEEEIDYEGPDKLSAEIDAKFDALDKEIAKETRRGATWGVWYVKWFNPYTKPPNGQYIIGEPYVVKDWDLQTERAPDYINKLADENPGYGVTWTPIRKPGTKWSPEAKARVRKQRMEERIKTKYPLFEQEFIEREIAAKPEYFDPEAIEEGRDYPPRKRTKEEIEAAKRRVIEEVEAEPDLEPVVGQVQVPETVSELKDQLRKWGYPFSGKKADLQERYRKVMQLRDDPDPYKDYHAKGLAFDDVERELQRRFIEDHPETLELPDGRTAPVVWFEDSSEVLSNMKQEGWIQQRALNAYELRPEYRKHNPWDDFFRSEMDKSERVGGFATKPKVPTEWRYTVFFTEATPKKPPRPIIYLQHRHIGEPPPRVIEPPEIYPIRDPAVVSKTMTDLKKVPVGGAVEVDDIQWLKDKKGWHTEAEPQRKLGNKKFAEEIKRHTEAVAEPTEAVEFMEEIIDDAARLPHKEAWRQIYARIPEGIGADESSRRMILLQEYYRQHGTLPPEGFEAEHYYKDGEFVPTAPEVATEPEPEAIKPDPTVEVIPPEDLQVGITGEIDLVDAFERTKVVPRKYTREVLERSPQLSPGNFLRDLRKERPGVPNKELQGEAKARRQRMIETLLRLPDSEVEKMIRGGIRTEEAADLTRATARGLTGRRQADLFAEPEVPAEVQEDMFRPAPTVEEVPSEPRPQVAERPAPGRQPEPVGAVGREVRPGREPGGIRPAIEVAGGEHLPTPREMVPAGRYPKADTDQRLAINLALDAYDQGKKAFMLADGTGVGKTLQQLVVAREMVDATRKPALIVTQNKQIIEGNFKKQARQFDVATDMIEFATYDGLRTGKAGNKPRYSIAIFDEGHNLKNAQAAKTIAAKQVMEKADKLMFATATPMDRPTGAEYFLSEITGIPKDQVRSRLGYHIETRVTADGTEFQTPVLNEGVSWGDVLDNIIEMRNEAIGAGTMIRREYPFFGDMGEVVKPLPAGQAAEQQEIERYWDYKIRSARSRTAKRNAAGQRTLELGRWTEPYKVDDIFDAAMKDYNEGNSVIIVAEGINPTAIRGLGHQEKVHPGFIQEFEKKLKDAGITDWARIHGAKPKAKEVEKFQSNQVRWAVMTPKSGGAGIDLDDSLGNYPRVMHIATPNFSGDVFEQILGRVSRRNTKSPARVVFHFFSDATSDAKRMAIAQKKIQMLRRIQAGEDIDRAAGLVDQTGEYLDLEEIGGPDYPTRVGGPPPKKGPPTEFETLFPERDETKIEAWRRHVQQGETEESRRTLESLTREAMKPLSESQLDQASTKYIETGKMKDFRDMVPAGMGNISMEELIRYDPDVKGLVATITDKKGKPTLAIRRSGYYATPEFAEQIEGFKDISRTAQRTQDSIRLFETMDQGHFADPKTKMGPFQRYGAWPARRTEWARMRFTDKQKGIIAEAMDDFNVHTVKKKRAAFRVANHVDNKNAWDQDVDKILKIDGVKKALRKFNPQVRRQIVGFAQAYRRSVSILRSQANAMRKRQGRKEIPWRSRYVTKQMRDENILDALFRFVGKKEDLFSKPGYVDLSKEPRSPEQAYFPHELPQSQKDYAREENLVKLWSDYADAIARDIFDTNIIQNYKVLAAVARSKGLTNIANALEVHAAEVYGGVTTPFTAEMRNVVGERPEVWMKRIRKGLNRAVFPLNWTWNLGVQTSSSALTQLRYGSKHMIQGMEYFLSPTMHRAVRNNAYSSIVKSRWGGGMAYQDVADSIVKNRRLQGTRLDTFDHWMNIITSTFEDALTGQSVVAAYYHGKEKLGLEGRALWEYASEGGAKTQSMYHYSGVPGLLRDPYMKGLFPFQTFFFEVYNTAREVSPDTIARVIGRAGAYETMSASSAAGKAELKRRLWKLAQFWAYMTAFNMGVDKAIGRKPWQWYSPIPMASLFGLGIRRVSPFLPIQYVGEFTKGIGDVLKYDDFGKLINWILRYHFTAGVQLSRTLRGIEATIKGEVRDVRGNLMYPIHGTSERIRAITMGPERTKAGIERAKQRRESKEILEYEEVGPGIRVPVGIKKGKKTGEGSFGRGRGTRSRSR